MGGNSNSPGRPDPPCAHLAINLPGYEMRIDDEVRPTYGYVQVFFDWAKLKEQSGIYDRFDEHGVLFKLTRSDKMYDAEADAYSYKEVTIAQSPNGGATLLADDSTEIVPVETSNGEWIMHVGYSPESLRPSWYAGLTAAVVVMSFLFAVVVAIVMVEKVRNRDLLYKMMPPSAVKKLHRGQTVVERFHNVSLFFSFVVVVFVSQWRTRKFSSWLIRVRLPRLVHSSTPFAHLPYSPLYYSLLYFSPSLF